MVRPVSEPVVLVTGAAGLIGHAVHRQLESAGTRVLALDRHGGTVEGLSVERCDVGDIHRLYALTSGIALDGVIHCGAYSGPMVELDNPNAIVTVNIGGTANVLELARARDVRRLVFSSSTSVYGDTPEGPLAEDQVLRSANVYAASKVAGEHLVEAYARRYGVNATSLRLSWVYGPRRTTQCAIATMLRDALSGRPTHFPFGADFRRQYLYVEDAAAALVAAYRTERCGQMAYNVTGGTNLTLEEIAGRVTALLPRAAITCAPGRDPVDTVQGEFDIAAAERDFGYRPTWTLDDGLRRYADWLRNESANEPVGA